VVPGQMSEQMLAAVVAAGLEITKDHEYTSAPQRPYRRVVEKVQCPKADADEDKQDDQACHASLLRAQVRLTLNVVRPV